MKNIRLNISVLFIVCLIPIIFLGQENKVNIKKHLTISEGLAHNGVTSILEDSKGYLWFGTYDGLNRYDGHELKMFKNTIDNQLFLSNRIRALKEDKNGNIWIGTDEGITLYDYRYDQFRNLYANNSRKGPVVRSFSYNETENTVLVITETDGILLFDTDYNFIKQFTLPNSTTINRKVFEATFLERDTYLLAASEGLYAFDIKTGDFQKILSDEISLCRSVSVLKNNTLLLAQQNGIARVSYEIIEENLEYKLIRKDILPDYRFKSAHLDQANKLWLGTLNDGALVFNNVEAFKNNSNDYFQFKPKNGLLRVSTFKSVGNSDFWMGTFDKGIYQFDTSINPFKSFGTFSEFDFGVNNRHIRHISKLNDNRFYITKNRGGLALFNINTNLFEPIPILMPKSYLSKISAIFIDSKKNTLIKVTNGGYFFKKLNENKPHKIDTSLLPNFAADTPYKFAEDKYGYIWVSCKNDVFRLKIDANGKVLKLENLNANELFNTNKLSLVRYVYADPIYDFIWLGTADDGLIRINISKDEPLKSLNIDKYRNNGVEYGIPSNFVSSILRTPKGELWIGTEGAGICNVIHSDRKPEFISYSEKQGLSNNVVKSILLDEQENLWVGTNIGLNKFTADEKSFRRFKKEDGLTFEDFWYTATNFENGKLLFTGLEGFSYFHPADIISQEKLPKVEFSDFRISNQKIKPLDYINNRVLITERLVDSAKINLRYNENVFALEMHSLHFKAPDNHRIKYKLSPIDIEWHKVNSDQKTITYSGLQPDDYKLEVSASNAIGEWTIPKTLFITIAPPLWKTTMAYILYILCALLFLGAILYYILKMQKLRYSIQIEKIERDTIKTINDAKLRFFANISHELKTPLNLITSPVRLLLTTFKGNKDVEEKLNIVERQSRKISQLIDQVNDFEKVEANVMEMEYSRFYFDSFLKEMLIDFHFLAKNSNRVLEVIADDSNIVVSADRNKLEKIFNNLLSNAFKYSDSGDIIKVRFNATEKDLSITVTDTGRGIDQEDLPYIFERFFRSRKNQNEHASGSGIGLAFSKRLVEMHYGYIEAKSKLGEGTAMKVRLPIVKKESSFDQEIKRKEILVAENDFVNKNEWLHELETIPIEVSNDYAEHLIYYVEDNVDMQIYVSNMLSKNFKVEVFNNGADCLVAMDEQWPEIIISDIQMPVMNGMDLCKRIKSDMKTSHIPIILLTALADIENRIQGIKDGADAYIKKPFDTRQLVTRIVALLENKKRLRERFEIGLPMIKDNNINNRNDDAFLEKLYDLIADNLSNENLDMDEFARKLFMNRTHFYQKVKSLTNKTPFELLKMYRLRKAAELLAQDKKLSVSEVYVLTGFKSRTHFSKLFKEKYKVSPGKFVKSELSN
ncbi:response regulator [Kriegella sp. EG-1]|nr:response regulator [Flavobacteriaceae bacterium EG-1]